MFQFITVKKDRECGRAKMREWERLRREAERYFRKLGGDTERFERE